MDTPTRTPVTGPSGRVGQVSRERRGCPEVTVGYQQAVVRSSRRGGSPGGARGPGVTLGEPPSS